MKKAFLEIKKIELEDIITTSSGLNVDEGEGGASSGGWGDITNNNLLLK